MILQGVARPHKCKFLYYQPLILSNYGINTLSIAWTRGPWLTSQDLKNAIIRKTLTNVVFYKNITTLGKIDIK